MKRAASYARFSSDRQRDRSVEDQHALNAETGARFGAAVILRFEDRGISGASIVNRPGVNAMIAAAEARLFDVLIVEDVDRLARDQADYHKLRKALDFLGIEIVTAGGTVSRIDGSLRALMSELYIDNLATHTRRGMAGRIREGKSAGGRAYGYRPIAGEAGRLAIVPEEAEIVREIYTRFAAGETPREIAGDLNRRAVKPPRGARWNASTVNGSKARGSGILQNALYAGELVWNKVRMVKDSAGNRISRPNPRTQWQRRPVPELAIVTPAQFAAAAARKKSAGEDAPHLRRAPRRMLSGMLRCGACGAGMAIYGKGQVGETRVRCSRHAESRTCPDPHSFRLDVIEATVTGALRKELQHPELLPIYVRTYHAERKRLAAGGDKRRGEIERRTGEIDRAIRRATDALLSGVGDAADIDARCKELRAERERLAAERDALPDASPVIELHPAALKGYAEQIKRLESAIGGTIAAGDRTAIDAIRDLVESVIVRPGGARGTVEVEITGRLAYLCADAYPNGRRSGGSMVAGGRLTPSARTGEQLFRLFAAG